MKTQIDKLGTAQQGEPALAPELTSTNNASQCDRAGDSPPCTRISGAVCETTRHVVYEATAPIQEQRAVAVDPLVPFYVNERRAGISPFNGKNPRQ